eukprot:1893279-Karenia_brevis.AAC.1
MSAFVRPQMLIMVWIPHVHAVEQNDGAILVHWKLFKESPLNDLEGISIVQIHISCILFDSVTFHEIVQGLVGDVLELLSPSPLLPIILKTETRD